MQPERHLPSISSYRNGILNRMVWSGSHLDRNIERASAMLIVCKLDCQSVFACRITPVAEREALPRNFNKRNKLRGLGSTRTTRVCQHCAPKSMDFASSH